MKGIECVDHLGNRYGSITEMCKHYRVNDSVFRRKIKAGKNIEEALSKVDNTIYDHLGNKFSCVAEMCRHYDINPESYRNRIKAGINIEEALTTKSMHKIAYTDHKGNVFESRREMCKFWGINTATFNSRIKAGCSIKEALTSGSYTIYGKKYKSLSNLCEHYDIDKSTIRRRINAGFDREILIIKSSLNSKIILKYIGIDNKAYYTINGRKEFYTARQIVEHYRPDLLSKYDEYNPTGEYNPYRG